MTLPHTPDLDDVLEAFATEPSSDDAVLATYVRRYPQFALALADFAHELRLTAFAEEQASTPDSTWQAESWRRFESAAEAMSSGSIARYHRPVRRRRTRAPGRDPRSPQHTDGCTQRFPRPPGAASERAEAIPSSPGRCAEHRPGSTPDVPRTPPAR